MTTLDANAVMEELKGYILQEFLPGEDPEELAFDTPLISTGILDSIATLKLAEHLETQYGIQVAPHELDADFMNTIGSIKDLVLTKKG